MSRCTICNKETPVTCLCGFCPSCITWRGHNGCIEELNRRREEEKIK